jgi:putative hydrolase of the HAD superfamily
MIIKHIFWDLDHTLWDFEKNSVGALQEVYNNYKLQSLGINSFDDFNINYHIYNDKYWDRFRKGFITRAAMRWKRMYVTLQHYAINNETLAKEMGESYLDYLPLQPNLHNGAIEILEYCKAKKILQHIITNGFEATQAAKMKHSGIAPYFSKIITSEQAMSLKPNKEIFDYALQQTNATTNNSIMIGDANDVDILGATNAGIKSIWFNVDNKPDASTATWIVNNLLDIKNIV